MPTDKEKKLIFISKKNLCMLNKTGRHMKGNELRAWSWKNEFNDEKKEEDKFEIYLQL